MSFTSNTTFKKMEKVQSEKLNVEFGRFLDRIEAASNEGRSWAFCSGNPKVQGFLKERGFSVNPLKIDDVEVRDPEGPGDEMSYVDRSTVSMVSWNPQNNVSEIQSLQTSWINQFQNLLFGRGLRDLTIYTKTDRNNSIEFMKESVIDRLNNVHYNCGKC